MQSTSSNLRKAAVFFRSLDSDTSAMLLAQLSPHEAAQLREAIRAVGAIDPDEASDVVAEFRRMKPVIAERDADGVELRLTTQLREMAPVKAAAAHSSSSTRRFEFLEHAPVEALVPYLSREHVQTIAVVLSLLPAGRAAAVLVGLPEKTQAEALERLTTLGETDPESLVVLEQELAAWLANRSAARRATAGPNETVASILAAAEPATRKAIVANLKTHRSDVADRLRFHDKMNTMAKPVAPPQRKPHPPARASLTTSRQLDLLKSRIRGLRPQSEIPAASAAPSIAFDALTQFDDASLAAVLAKVDANVLMLALTASSRELIDRISRQLPKRMGRAFRRQLRQLGPTRLADVEAAQHSICRVAAQLLGQQREKTSRSAT
jgi:flagellar motor switch protein FliG